MQALGNEVLLVYTNRLTNRLGYALSVVFTHVLHVKFEITTNVQFFEAYEGAKLCYGDKQVSGAVWIKSSKLLYETTIKDQEFLYRDDATGGFFFPVYGKEVDFPFDIFAATFYLVTRYEEYMPHHNDAHGRYMHDESLAYKHSFLDKPVVDIWSHQLLNIITSRFPFFIYPKKKFNFELTVDIDAAYKYRNKGVVRTLIGFGKDILGGQGLQSVRKRLRVIAGKDKDVYDTFDYILTQSSAHGLYNLLFFVLVGDYYTYDKGISYRNSEFNHLLQHIGDYAGLGLHSSYKSSSEPKCIEMELRRLESMLHRPIHKNRCHFLRLSFPQTYRELVKYGITDDYTMGYALHSGFRAGISCPYPFYDLEGDSETSLIIHPFTFMDSTLRKHMNLSPQDAINHVKQMMDTLHAVGGTMCCIFHNETVSDEGEWHGWKRVFEEVLNYADELKNK